MMRNFGYVRVSTKDQNEIRQLDALKDIQIHEGCLFIDKQSGKDFKRPAYQRMLRKIKKGDVLFIKSIDRLGRNYEEILDQWHLLTKQKEVDIVVLDMPLLDTRDENKDLTGKFIADLVLQILSYVAQSEREFIKQRQAEGIACAKARGVQFGRPTKPLPDEFYEVKELYLAEMISSREAARRCHVAQDTFLRWMRFRD